MMKKFVSSKHGGYFFITVLVTTLSLISVTIQTSSSTSRLLLNDQAKIERLILHNAKGDHACHCHPPMIAMSPGFEIKDIGSDKASFHWKCDVAATYQVNYGTTNAKGTFFPATKPTAYYTDYTVTVTGLKPNTTYHAGPYSFAKNSNVVKKHLMDKTDKSDFTFKTLSGTSITDESKKQETALVMYEVSVTRFTTNEVTITWKTNIPSTSQVDYGTTQQYGLKSGVNTELTCNHVIQLFDLKPGTTYYYKTGSYTSLNPDPLYSADNTFTTRSKEDRLVDNENYYSTPNPAFDKTEFYYYLYQPITSVSIDVFTLSGKKVAALQSPVSSLAQGWNRVSWNLNDMAGKRLGNGLYLCEMKFVKGNMASEVKNLRLTVKN